MTCNQPLENNVTEQYLLVQNFEIKGEHIPELATDLVDLVTEKDLALSSDIEIIEEAAELYHFEVEWGEGGIRFPQEKAGIVGLVMLDWEPAPKQMVFLKVLARYAVPGSYITAMDKCEDIELWQWYFDHGKVFTRYVALTGLVSSEEDKFLSDRNLEPKTGLRLCHRKDCLQSVYGPPKSLCDDCEKESHTSGYANCLCYDCGELVVVPSDELSESNGFCDECVASGCSDLKGFPHKECQRPGAYCAPDCPTCGNHFWVWYAPEEESWMCDGCGNVDVTSSSKNLARSN